MRARVEDAANHRAHALEAYRRLYYDYPLTEEAAEAPAALSRLQAAGEVSVETDRALARAERLFAARRWADARDAFVALQSGRERRRQGRRALRIAECDYYLNNRRAAREALARDVRRSARGRGPLLPPAGDQDAGPGGVPAAGAQAGGGVSRHAVGRAGAQRAGDAPGHARPGRRGGHGVPPVDPRVSEEPAHRARGLEGGLARLPERRTSRKRSRSSSPRPPTSRAATTARRGSTGPAARASGWTTPRPRTPASAWWSWTTQNSYYGRLASGILKSKKEAPVLARIGAATPVASIAGVEPTGDIIRALVGARHARRRAARGGVRAEGLRRFAAAPGHFGVDSPPAGLRADRRRAVRRAARRHHHDAARVSAVHGGRRGSAAARRAARHLPAGLLAAHHQVFATSTSSTGI